MYVFSVNKILFKPSTVLLFFNSNFADFFTLIVIYDLLYVDLSAEWKADNNMRLENRVQKAHKLIFP